MDPMDRTEILIGETVEGGYPQMPNRFLLYVGVGVKTLRSICEAGATKQF